MYNRNQVKFQRFLLCLDLVLGFVNNVDLIHTIKCDYFVCFVSFWMDEQALSDIASILLFTFR